MNRLPQILIGLVREGNTDKRLLENIIERTFMELACECNRGLDIIGVKSIDGVKERTFADTVIQASKKGVEEFGITVLCVHADADAETDNRVWQNKITPAKERLEKEENDICKVMVPIIPIQMSEAWMLADKKLLKKQIMTNESDNDLEIEKHPEQYSDPKDVIENAIRIANREKTKRRRKDMNISELYQPIGQLVDLRKLRQLPSFRKFEDHVRAAYKDLNYMN